MIFADPRSILLYLAKQYDLLRNLYEEQFRHGGVDRSTLEQFLRDAGQSEESLLEYRILVPEHPDFAFHKPYLDLFEFIHQQFRPLLPEEIQRHGSTIEELFRKLKEGNRSDPNARLDILYSLDHQIRDFNTAIRHNTKALLDKSRELKANDHRLDYTEKIRQARYLIDTHITPLNTILDVSHSQSITSILRGISTHVNLERLRCPDEQVRRSFEKTYFLLKHVIDDLNRQSAILTSELIPLIQRIRTESEYLRGFLHLLRHPREIPVKALPVLYKSRKDNLYSPFVRENLSDFLQQYAKRTDMILPGEDTPVDYWFFDRPTYQRRLEADLPVEDFFSWCRAVIGEEVSSPSIDQYFQVTGLLMDTVHETYLFPEEERTRISFPEAELELPRITLQPRAHVSGKT